MHEAKLIAIISEMLELAQREDRELAEMLADAFTPLMINIEESYHKRDEQHKKRVQSIIELYLLALSEKTTEESTKEIEKKAIELFGEKLGKDNISRSIIMMKKRFEELRKKKNEQNSS